MRTAPFWLRPTAAAALGGALLLLLATAPAAPATPTGQAATPPVRRQ
ncbi:hypothetical protein SHIRM173S_04768 [Streptomyces hirsutus]